MLSVGQLKERRRDKPSGHSGGAADHIRRTHHSRPPKASAKSCVPTRGHHISCASTMRETRGKSFKMATCTGKYLDFCLRCLVPSKNGRWVPVHQPALSIEETLPIQFAWFISLRCLPSVRDKRKNGKRRRQAHMAYPWLSFCSIGSACQISPTHVT